MKVKSYIKSANLILLCFVIIITLFSKFLYTSQISSAPKIVHEEYDNSLATINSIQKFDSLVEQKYNTTHDITQTILFIDAFLKKRFYHGYSELSLKENWIAVLCSKFFWAKFIYPVSSNDILKYPMAACSQQGILFQDQLHKLKIPYETIAFKSYKNDVESGHYAVSIFYDNKWHFYDTNQEPVIIDSTMPCIETIIETKLYKKMYTSQLNRGTQLFFKSKSYTKTNKNVYSAQRMVIFHTITRFLSNWLWSILLVLYCLFLMKNKQKDYP